MTPPPGEQPLLVTISYSHYCEKARWALDRAGLSYREAPHAPFGHLLATIPRGGRSTPLLKLPGRTLTDSSEILQWIDQKRPGLIFPRDPAARDSVLELEDRFDTKLGPHVRRVAYGLIFEHNEPLAPLIRATTTGLTRALSGVIGALAPAGIRRALRITPAGVARSQAVLDETLDELDTLLGDGRQYLVGDAFTAADLTLAALLAPIVDPPEHPIGRRAKAWASLEPLRTATVARPVGAFALRMYRDQRHIRGAGA